MLDRFGEAACGQFAEIEAGGEMLAFAVEHDDADILGEALEENFEAEHGRIVQRVALARAGKPQQRNRAAPLRGQRRRQVGGKAAVERVGQR